MLAGRLIAIDPSLSCSGWALFSIESEELLSVGKIRSLPPKYTLSDRLLDMQEKVQEIFKACNLKMGDALVCEAPTTMKDPRAAFRVEQVRGIFETVARQKKILVPGRINPRSVQREVMGLKGKQLVRETVKATAVLVVSTLYKPSLEHLEFPTDQKSLTRHQDIVDAILIGRLAVIRMNAASAAGIAPQTLFEEKLTSRAPRLRR